MTKKDLVNSLGEDHQIRDLGIYLEAPTGFRFSRSQKKAIKDSFCEEF